VEGVKMAILTGGCNASRADFASACLAALSAYSPDSSNQDVLGFIPEEWKSKTTNFKQASDLVKKLLEMRTDKPAL